MKYLGRERNIYCQLLTVITERTWRVVTSGLPLVSAPPWRGLWWGRSRPSPPWCPSPGSAPPRPPVWRSPGWVSWRGPPGRSPGTWTWSEPPSAGATGETADLRSCPRSTRRPGGHSWRSGQYLRSILHARLQADFSASMMLYKKWIHWMNIRFRKCHKTKPHKWHWICLTAGRVSGPSYQVSSSVGVVTSQGQSWDFT